MSHDNKAEHREFPIDGLYHVTVRIEDFIFTFPLAGDGMSLG